MDLSNDSGSSAEGDRGGEQIKWFTLMSPLQQCAAYKQTELTDDTMEALVSPANHLSTAVWTPGNVERGYGRLFSPPPLSLSLHQSVRHLSLSSSPKHRLTLSEASWKVISHYFLCCLSSHTHTVTCQLSAAAREIMNYVCVSLSMGAATRSHRP